MASVVALGRDADGVALALGTAVVPDDVVAAATGTPGPRTHPPFGWRRTKIVIRETLSCGRANYKQIVRLPILTKKFATAQLLYKFTVVK